MNKKSITFSVLFILMIFLSSCGTKSDAVSIIGTWGGTELENFKKICASAGVKIKFETTRDLNSLLETRLRSENVPDIAILPNPAKLLSLAKRGHLRPLSFLSKKKLTRDYNSHWLKMGSYAGKLYGLFYKAANKSIIWYNPQEFKKHGWKIPKTWSKLMALSKKMLAAGKTPWSIGADIGWPLSDWIENIMVRTSGEKNYKKWIEHEIPWTSPDVKKAFVTWGEIVSKKDFLYGGRDGTLASSFQNAAFAVFRKDPKAYLYYEGDFISGIITQELKHVKLGKNIDFFPFPPIDKKNGNPIIVGADALAAFKLTKNVKKLITYLASKKAHEQWVKLGGFISHNRNVSLKNYPDYISRKSAKMISSAKVVLFDASDLMHPAVGNKGGFWDACKRYIQNPDKLDKILKDMERLAAKHY